MLRREELRGLRHVVGEPAGMEHAAAVERVLHGARVKARVVLRVHSFLCVGSVVASSDLIGVVAVVADPVPLQQVSRPCSSPVSTSRWPCIDPSTWTRATRGCGVSSCRSSVA